MSYFWDSCKKPREDPGEYKVKEFVKELGTANELQYWRIWTAIAVNELSDEQAGKFLDAIRKS